ncbi:MAG: hypothetical protein U0350_49385 [Caldilineaceae bacterium]
MTTATKLKTLIESLAAYHQIDVTTVGNTLRLAGPAPRDQLCIAGLSAQRIGITHYLTEGAERLGLAISLVFEIDECVWTPVELIYADEIWQRYSQQTDSSLPQTFEAEVDLVRFSDYFAVVLVQQGWLEHSRRLDMGHGWSS